MMAELFREAITKLKQFYISKILETGFYRRDYEELNALTVSELEAVYQKECPHPFKKSSAKQSKIM